LGAVPDTGAQRRAINTPAEILSRTGTTVNMKQQMTGILMGTETIDQHGKFFILVVPDVSVYDPGMSDSLVLAGRLMEAGCNVDFRMIPDDAFMDGSAPATFKFSLYGGSIQVTTPDNLIVIVMEYAGHNMIIANSPNNFKVSTCDYTLT